MKLNIGCNRHKLGGYVDADIVPFPEAEIVLDAAHIPFQNSQIEEIYAGHLLEHLKDPLGFFLECHRILKDDGLLVVVVPDPGKLPTDDPIIIGILFGFWFVNDYPDPDVPEAMHRTWWNATLLHSVGCHLGFDFERTVHPWDDEHLVIGANWHTGIVFRKAQLDPVIALGYSHYRRIIDEVIP